VTDPVAASLPRLQRIAYLSHQVLCGAPALHRFLHQRNLPPDCCTQGVW
jgi:hypothetical protein